MLRAAEIRAGYADLEILRGVTVEVGAGEIVAIIGPNGAGKSTLVKAIFGLVPPRAGRVLLRGVDITGRRPEDVAGLGIGYVPQTGNVFGALSVEENLEMGGFLRPHDISQSIERVLGLFPDLRGRMRDRASRLSGGQRQMLALARALMTSPTVLLLDEPSAGLAPNIQANVFGHVKSIARTGTSVLLVEQNARRALRIADWAYVLESGQNKYEGPGEALLADANVGRLYLGADAAGAA